MNITRPEMKNNPKRPVNTPEQRINNGNEYLSGMISEIICRIEDP